MPKGWVDVDVELGIEHRRPTVGGRHNACMSQLASPARKGPPEKNLQSAGDQVWFPFVSLPFAKLVRDGAKPKMQQNTLFSTFQVFYSKARQHQGNYQTGWK